MYAVGRVSLSSSKYNAVVLVSLLSRVFLFLLPPHPCFLAPGFLRVRTMTYSSFYPTYPNTVLGTKTARPVNGLVFLA